MTSLPKLYNSWFCPFAQRAWIALLHKGVQFDCIEQVPYDKTPEWLAISPRGLVPVIRHDGESVWESTVCIEYVDEAWPQEPKLLPSTPHGRAKVRMWSDFITKKIVPPYYAILQKQSKDEQESWKKKLLADLGILVTAMNKDGPFFMGKQLGMVDIMLYPFAHRFYVLKEFRNFEVPSDPIFDKFRKWQAAMDKLQCVKDTLAARDKLLESYERYRDNTAQSEVADAIRKGTVLP